MKPATILLIEDHASVRTVLAQVLQGQQGCEQFRAQPTV